ncbi:MAG TPA: twin-arginine translocase TatA/TatE family subunit [Pseudonocardiaceae bacterium]|nr:twin-arginine translocase TatA/TatE family subunit [Pseudonocardiaceae bacterium]
MLDLSVEKLAILAVVALFILGPERLPTAAAALAAPSGKSRSTPPRPITNFAANSARNSTKSTRR